MEFLAAVGRSTINFIKDLGGVGLLLFSFLKALFEKPRLHLTFEQMQAVGVKSTLIVFLTSMFVGMVEALQIYHGFHKFGAEDMIGYTVAVSLGRELSPVLTALMIVARNVSAMAAELGTMRVTQQIDALEVMAVNPVNFLVAPRVVATVIMLPALVVLSNAVGNLGGYFVSIGVLNLNPTAYIRNIQTYIDLSDLTYGLIKAAVFGLIISLIGCYMGLTTKGGSKGVGISTTKAVVASSIAVLVADYFLTAFLF
ncbi:MlaE family ABC transporter permease [Hippea jasoniae]|uniref:MlaE family ABC transporter permease n=1 Tax=Hippea jasoniae TaxID=944479 RepID=UPI00054D4D58|nr:ABC transporter permease [Hippea jasoniae]